MHAFFKNSKWKSKRSQRSKLRLAQKSFIFPNGPAGKQEACPTLGSSGSQWPGCMVWSLARRATSARSASSWVARRARSASSPRRCCSRLERQACAYPRFFSVRRLCFSRSASSRPQPRSCRFSSRTDIDTSAASENRSASCREKRRGAGERR